MINEEKVKLMTKMAIYELGEGKNDLEIRYFHMKEYIRMEMIKSIILNTIVYCVILGVGLLLVLDKVMECVHNHQHMKYVLLFFTIYLVFIAVEALYTRSRAKSRYMEAWPRIRNYKKNLTKLHFMYELEEENIVNPKQEKLEEKIEEELDGETIDF